MVVGESDGRSVPSGLVILYETLVDLLYLYLQDDEDAFEIIGGNDGSGVGSGSGSGGGGGGGVMPTDASVFFRTLNTIVLMRMKAIEPDINERVMISQFQSHQVVDNGGNVKNSVVPLGKEEDDDDVVVVSPDEI